MDAPLVSLEVESIRSDHVKAREPLDFTMRVVNHTDCDQSPLVRLDAYLSDGSPVSRNPLIQPRSLRIRAHQQVEVPVRIPDMCDPVTIHPTSLSVRWRSERMG
jgi:hypothetical protein